jgi:hypothetical protein
LFPGFKTFPHNNNVLLGKRIWGDKRGLSEHQILSDPQTSWGENTREVNKLLNIEWVEDGDNFIMHYFISRPDMPRDLEHAGYIYAALWRGMNQRSKQPCWGKKKVSVLLAQAIYFAHSTP